MADGNPYIDEIEAALKAAQQNQTAPPAAQVPSVTGTPLSPAPPGRPDYQAEISTALANPLGTFAPPVPETVGPPFPTAPYNALDVAASGYTATLSDAYRAATEAARRYLKGETPGFDYPQAATEIQLGRQAYTAANPATSLAANIAGTIVSPVAKAGTAAVTAAPTLLKLPVSALTGAGIGATQGAVENPNDPLRGAITGAEWGGGIGAATPVAGYVGGKVFPGLTPEARILRAAGVNLTPGSAVGGIPGATETALSHIPVIGSPINRARAEALTEQFPVAVAKQVDTMNRDAVNAPLTVIGETLNPNTTTGHSAIAEMQLKLKDAFNRAVPTAGGALDAPASNMINNAVTNAKLLPRTSDGDQFEKFVQTNILGKVQGTTEADTTSALNAATTARQQAEADLSAAKDQAMRMPGPGSDANLANATQRAQQASAAESQAQQQLTNVQMGGKPFGTLSGKDFQDTDEALGNEAHKYLKSKDPRDNDLGQAYLDLQGNLRDWLERVSPQNATDLQNANLAWRMAKPVQLAARGSNDPEGIFTTANLRSAVRANSTLADFASGRALMQPFANAAETERRALMDAGATLKKASGSHGSGIEGAGATAGIAAAGAELLTAHPNPLLISTMATAYPLLMGAYSQPGRRAITGLLNAAGTIPPLVTGFGPQAAQFATGPAGFLSGLLNPATGPAS